MTKTARFYNLASLLRAEHNYGKEMTTAHY